MGAYDHLKRNTMGVYNHFLKKLTMGAHNHFKNNYHMAYNHLKTYHGDIQLFLKTYQGGIQLLTALSMGAYNHFFFKTYQTNKYSNKHINGTVLDSEVTREETQARRKIHKERPTKRTNTKYCVVGSC